MVHLLKEIQMYQDLLGKTYKDPERQGIPDEVSLYNVGQKVVYVHEGCRGIIVDYDLYCTATDGFASDDVRPDRNQPWYHVLIHGSDRQAGRF